MHKVTPSAFRKDKKISCVRDKKMSSFQILNTTSAIMLISFLIGNARSLYLTASQLKLHVQPCSLSAVSAHVPPNLHVVSSHTSSPDPPLTQQTSVQIEHVWILTCMVQMVRKITPHSKWICYTGSNRDSNVPHPTTCIFNFIPLWWTKVLIHFYKNCLIIHLSIPIFEYTCI